MSSMMLRSAVFSSSKSLNENKIEYEQNSINEYKKSIQDNKYYKNLTEKEQRALLNKGSGKLFKNWDTIFKESKFNEKGVFTNFYFMPSVYAHSEGILALQLKETKHLMDHEHMKETLYLMLFYSYLMTSIMIKNITNKFPLIKKDMIVWMKKQNLKLTSIISFHLNKLTGSQTFSKTTDGKEQDVFEWGCSVFRKNAFPIKRRKYILPHDFSLTRF